MSAGLRCLLFPGAVAATLPAAALAANAFAAALDAQWDFGKPAVSEQRFRAELARWPAESPEAQEVRTQVARSLGLQRRFDDAHALLDTVEARLATLPAHVRVRYLLERGRALNSSGARQRSAPLFVEALELAERDRDEYYAIDAAEAAQKDLLAEFDRLGETDGYVYEELSEIARARGDADGARPWAAKAHAALKDDAFLAVNGAPRLARLAAIAAGNAPAPARP